MQVHGNISHAMRENYNEYGVDEYYRKVAATYRNPFFASIKQVVFSIMTRWYEESKDAETVRILDMAAGSGEVTTCLLDWERSHRQPENTGTTPEEESRGAFIPLAVRQRLAQKAQGGKRISLPERFKLKIVATDPYTAAAYTAQTSRACHPLSFADLTNGALPLDTDDNPPIWDLVICSFALHLVPTASELWALLYELSTKARWLVVIAPHKKPDIKESWGWNRWDIAKWQAASEAETEGENASGSEIIHEK